MSNSATIEELNALYRNVLDLIEKSNESLTKQFKATDERMDKRFREAEARFKENEALQDKRFKETDEQFKETDKRIKKAFDLFESQWGKLIETLVAGDLVNLLRARGIQVTDTSIRRKGAKHGMNYEFDIIAHNGDEIVVVEVKTTLRAKHVKTFVEQLEKIKELLPEYRDFKVYGAIAYLDEADDSATYAENKKLFVIKATGDSAIITNKKDFTPRVF